jgi:general stress protein CsbA
LIPFEYLVIHVIQINSSQASAFPVMVVHLFQVITARLTCRTIHQTLLEAASMPNTCMALFYAVKLITLERLHRISRAEKELKKSVRQIYA